MNIAKLASVPFFVALFLGTTLSGVGQSHAGFQISDSMATQNSSADVQMDGTVLANESKPKTLEIFNDRYVPDNVRQKYNLDDSWFAKGQPSGTDPVSLAPQVQEIEVPVAPMQAGQENVMRARHSITWETPQIAVESWRARKGENIRDVLQRWSQRGGTSLMWASPDTPTLQKEFTFVGKFQDAVNELIRLEGGNKIHSQYRSEGLSPVMMSPASTITTNTVPIPEDEVALAEQEKSKAIINPLAQIFEPAKPKDEKPETRWFALSGAPLAEVIQVWADDAGVNVVWQSEKNFAIKESISQVGHFEDAVFRALNQYGREEVRPVGEIYRDAKSGQKTLLVRTEVN